MQTPTADLHQAAHASRAALRARMGHTFEKFWLALAFTRIVASRFEDRVLGKYFVANEYRREFGKAMREIFLGRNELSERLGYRKLRPS